MDSSEIYRLNSYQFHGLTYFRSIFSQLPNQQKIRQNSLENDILSFWKLCGSCLRTLSPNLQILRIVSSFLEVSKEILTTFLLGLNMERFGSVSPPALFTCLLN